MEEKKPIVPPVNSLAVALAILLGVMSPAVVIVGYCGYLIGAAILKKVLGGG